MDEIVMSDPVGFALLPNSRLDPYVDLVNTCLRTVNGSLAALGELVNWNCILLRELTVPVF